MGGCRPPCKQNYQKASLLLTCHHSPSASSRLQITSYKSQVACGLQRPVEASWARLFCDSAAGSCVTKAATSCIELIVPTGSQRHRNGIEYPADFQNKTPCADSQINKVGQAKGSASETFPLWILFSLYIHGVVPCGGWNKTCSRRTWLFSVKFFMTF